MSRGLSFVHVPLQVNTGLLRVTRLTMRYSCLHARNSRIRIWRRLCIGSQLTIRMEAKGLRRWKRRTFQKKEPLDEKASVKSSGHVFAAAIPGYARTGKSRFLGRG